MCVEFQLHPSELKSHWEAHILAKTSKILPISSSGLKELRGALSKRLEAAVSAQVQQRTMPQPTRAARPAAGPTSAAAATSSGGQAGSFAATHMSVPMVSERRYRYLQDRILDRGEALDDRIDEFENLVAAAYPDDGEVSDPWLIPTEDVLVVGRICMDVNTEDEKAKLNEKSMFLEPSRDTGTGKRIELVFPRGVSHRDGYQTTPFFPGAIVALKGRGVGGRFVVREVLSLPPMINEPQTASATVCVAAGPFTFDSNLAYEPMSALLRTVDQREPNAVILLGPFVDSEHPLVAQGDLDEHPKQLFQKHILGRLKFLCDRRPNTKVYLVPSVRDAITDHAVFPQGEIGGEWTAHPNIHFQPNPTVINVNGVDIATCSLDALWDLKTREFVYAFHQQQGETDAMANSCRQFLEQRSFYPLFPPPRDAKVPFDLSHLPLSTLQTRPDALILPSRLAKFHKNVDGCAMVNPGLFSRSKTTGVFVTMTWKDGVVSVSQESVQLPPPKNPPP
ncbi:DNA polymerase alpha, subunit B [Auriculariales sp. MPI-PUGE-AT-0066]|nr:DNA polymerase alpha, subunit B [Auriculariales sp. MPI-PUGE-AT-0066]